MTLEITFSCKTGVERDWKLELASNQLCTFLPLGSFGRVMLAKNKRSGEFFAMKRLKKSDIIKLRQVDHVISENTILADIDHPFLVSYSEMMAWAGKRRRLCASEPLSQGSTLVLDNPLYYYNLFLNRSGCRGSRRTRATSTSWCSISQVANFSLTSGLRGNSAKSTQCKSNRQPDWAVENRNLDAIGPSCLCTNICETMTLHFPLKLFAN